MSLSIDQLWQQVASHLQHQRVDAARLALEQLRRLAPSDLRAPLLLGGIAWQQDRIRDAAEHALFASRCTLADADAVCNLIAALQQTGENSLAATLYSHPLLSGGTLSIPTLMRLSGLAQANGQHSLALDYLERARLGGAGGPAFDSFLGVQLAFHGRRDEAERVLETCVQHAPAAGRAALILSRLRKQSLDRNHLQNVSAGLAAVRHGSDDHAALLFARYKEFEDLERWEDAWQALAQANQIMHAALRHDSEAETASVSRLIETTANWSPRIHAKPQIGPQPIFIVGLPRSGTTILDRILGNHSKVANAGELGGFGHQLSRALDHATPLLPDSLALKRLHNIDFTALGHGYLAQTQWRAADKPYYVDKLPANWVVAGLIARALPQARILHLVRDPMDVCFSNYRAMFGASYAYSYELNALAHHHANYRRVMAHWQRVLPGRILDVEYQTLVAHADDVAQRVFEFCGLDPEAGCTEIARNPTTVATLSMMQARESIHAGHMGRWRNYRTHLESLNTALQQA